jgi:Arc/MetJ family transcription regulator
MRTNIVLDDELIAEAMRLAGIKTRREMVDRALREYVNRHRQREILGLAGEGLIDPSYDVRSVRAGMNRDSG